MSYRILDEQVEMEGLISLQLCTSFFRVSIMQYAHAFMFESYYSYKIKDFYGNEHTNTCNFIEFVTQQ
jgi:hypothetical protein